MADPTPVPVAEDGNFPVVPRALYYLAIDGTAAKDSVEYGRLLEVQGWHNLATEFLKPAADDATRLIDPAHPYLPISLFDASGKKKIAVVSPNGRDAKSQDPFWRRYAGEFPDEAPSGSHTWVPTPGFITHTIGRHTALEKSARYMNHLIAGPKVDTRTQDDGTVTAEFASSIDDPFAAGTLRTFAADLLLVSSHGWLGGFMRGNTAPEWSVAEPADARGPFVPARPYFVVGSAAEEGVGFSGPAWIILAQCSTVNEATSILWAQVLANSKPFVRGILAYEEVSPGPEGSVIIAENFFKAMTGKGAVSILKAWTQANAKQKWAAIVHEDAINDHFDDWRSFKPLASGATSETAGVYRGFLGSTPNSVRDGGTPIRAVPTPFVCRLSIKLPKDPPPTISPNNLPWGSELVITPATLPEFYAALNSNMIVDVTFRPPAGDAIVSVTFRWIHIRPSYHIQPDANALFQKMKLAADSPATQSFTVSHRDITIVDSSPAGADVMVLRCLPQPPAKLERAQLEAHHAYLWPSVDLTTKKGKFHHDFKTIGLSFYG